MKFDEYQKKSRKTARYPNIGKNFIYPLIGLMGESGEVAEKIKKIIRDKGGIVSKEDKAEITKEMGDVLWYIANLAAELKIPLSKIAEVNLEKLASRTKRNKIHSSGDNR